ncbi:unnamed protein product [Brachionus calyciflorus]|uniref:Armadillo repeat-containing protein 6 n=1 Tax=Brachionus calyciflorus TaxID=104777 RepID=A0A813R9U9_9BILA|nr:unnamed protein product [Brachionus calyciflorus]
MKLDASKKISQEYFDQIVQENVNDFEMSEQEAIDDAINQLKSQNCDLSTICKYPKQEQQDLLDSLTKMNTLLTSTPNLTEAQTQNLLDYLKIIKEKFDKDISFRCLATRSKTNPSVTQIFVNYLKDSNLKQHDNQIVEAFLNTFQSYITQQNDVLNSNDLKLLILLSEESFLGSNQSSLSALLKLLNSACLMNESNRQSLVENGLCENLMKIFTIYKKSDLILCDTCLLIRSLLLDDDLRVEFGHSHEHAKFIASKLNGLDVLLQAGLSNDNTLSEETLASIMLTLSKLAVRNEFCQEICDKGGLEFVLKCIDEKYLKNIALLKSALSLLKSICNNDQVRHQATKLNAVELVKQVLFKYMPNLQICEMACAALSPLLLRNVEGSEQLYACQAHQVLVNILAMHSTKPKLVKNCCLALRNSISRTKEFGEKLLELKIEEILRPILNQNDPICYDEVKSVLRDLGCQVDLKELWTGSGKNLTQ